ncbi:DNA N-glycosylase and apurinic/apyrimidinic (AP) lyase [Didymella heteroderae]|uniref:DNA N-glycosylase and apurinic/apyrimidinic (AP) lyase n=1 Tax=Didymella heteroderae TaxID=1769908 RepID=A0A9P5C5P2_9PLEO|nr:DNA N-glycosylase and apurinic/apyrimidinic (AP) lyase [Didymella heteroderae]
MLWRKQRSRSPPHLTSPIPEMEQHLASLDTPLPNSPVYMKNPSISPARDLPAHTFNAQDQAAAPASSAVDVVPEVNQPQDCTPKRTVKLPSSTTMSSKTLKLKTVRAKAQHLRPRLTTIIACVSYLLFHLMGVNIGFRAIQGYTEPRLQQAEVQLHTMQQALAIDYLLDMQLSNLHHVALQRSYKETRYEDCLIRGLNKANHVFGGIDFTSSPHIRNETADWVITNCDRLFYTPQLNRLRESKLRIRAEEIRKSIEELLRLVRYRLAVLQCKLHHGNPRLAAKPFIVESVTKTDKRPRVLPDVPYGFSLECQGQSRCRLIHSGPSTQDRTMKTLKDAIADASKEVKKWSYNFERLFHCMAYLIRPLAILQPLVVVFYLLATTLTMRSPPAPAPQLTFVEKTARVWKHICCCADAHLDPQEKHTVGLLINTALYALLGFELEHIIPEFDRLLLPVGLGFCIFHSVHAVVFVEPAPEDYSDESLYDIVRAVRESRLIAQGIEIPERAPIKAPSPKSKTSLAKPASKIAARFISPLTPIAEDLQQERKAMHTEQGKPLDDDDELSGYATETNSEFDSDVERASYVGLAGGVTPTDSEDDGLVIVEE